ncbi:MAG: class I SAM-dependent methyltransferase [Thaumarchaeota archaeon]|nr:class I SAM-dependent methyltransferase [Nitrososphaerota archaeon]
MKGKAEISDREREDWKLSAVGWKKWDHYLMQWLQPVGEKILDLVGLRDGDIVLDVATGSGEPGLSAATRVGGGRVIGLDISQEMVKIALNKARSQGIKNYEARVYSSSAFPFDADGFDAVVSRFGVMFLPDVLAGLREMARVLKPSRRACVAVWGPQNEGMKSVMGILTDELGIPESPPDAPDPFRCSETGKIGSLIRQAGFHNVEEVEVITLRTYSSVGQYWEYLLDMNAAVDEAFKKADEKNKKETKRMVDEALGSFAKNDGQVAFESVARVCCGVK